MGFEGMPCKDCGEFHKTTNVHCGRKPHPYVCPVCNGTGQVPEGFYRQNLDGVWTSSGVAHEPCRSCDKGILWRFI